MYNNLSNCDILMYGIMYTSIFGQSEEGLKYDFVVNPGGDPSQIVIELEGVTHVRVTADGELAFSTPFGELRKGPPYTGV